MVFVTERTYLFPALWNILKERVFTPETVFQYILPRLLTMKQRIPLWIIHKAGKSIKIVGLFNIQFVIDRHSKVYVIEVNPRASRTVPVMSKVTGIPMVDVPQSLSWDIK